MSDPQTLSYESPQTTLSGVGIGTIALQLVGVYCITLALPILSLFASILGTAGSRMGGGGGVGGIEMLVSLTMPGLYIVMGVLLIRLAPRLSRWLFRDAGGGVMAGPITTTTGQYLQAIAFAVIGVVIMIDAAPRIVWLVWTGLMDMGGRFGGFSMIVEPAAKFLLGLVLFLQSKGLAQLWHKIRAGGVMQSSDTTEPSP